MTNLSTPDRFALRILRAGRPWPQETRQAIARLVREYRAERPRKDPRVVREGIYSTYRTTYVVLHSLETWVAR